MDNHEEYMNGIIKKILPIMVALIMLGAFPLIAIKAMPNLVTVSAASSDKDNDNDNDNHNIKKPKIRSIQTREARAVQIPFTWKQYHKSTDVKVKVRIEDTRNGNITFQSIDSRVNGNGHGKVWVKNLKPSTEYRVKIKVRKLTLNRQSKYSSSKTFTTLTETRRSGSTQGTGATQGSGSTSNEQNTGSTGSSGTSDTNSSSSSE